MNGMAAFLDELRQSAGGDAVTTDSAALARAAVAGRPPAAVVAPADATGVAAVLALCAGAGVPVAPAGGGTWLAAAQAPAAPPVLISTRRLDAVTEYEPADLVIGVQAGVTLRDLQQRLRAERQTLPLDPPAADRATIGATLALAASGPLRAAHGTPRDMVLGLEIATGDGRLLRFGGRVVKNVAGYDVVRLVTGSRGALGIITSAFLLLRALPEEDGTWLADAADAATSAAIALAVRDRMDCDALEVLGPGLAPALDRGGRDGSWAVAARVRGSGAAVAEAGERLASVAGFRRLDVAAASAFWPRLGELEALAPACLRVADLPASLPATLATAAAIADGDRGWRTAAHGASGIVRLWRPPDAPPLEAGRLGPALDDVGSAHVARGGSLRWAVLPSALAALRRTEAAEPGALALMRELARAFDPAGILPSPWRGVSA
jgi:glycolate oxidase FAD binding subunit